MPSGDLEFRLREALAPRYVLLRSIGRGGMGSVFLAREPELSRLVAVKILSLELSQNEVARARFVREAQAAASIAHPNVISIYAIGALDDGTPYFVMQYASGDSIAARLAREGPVSATEATRMVGELASALAAAHARGIVHRDIKPANVLYDEESGRVLITDFGIAAVRASQSDADQKLTGTGMVLGTPQYMSPEQLSADATSDRTDVYALGLVAHELLTGTGPYNVSSPAQYMAAHLRDTPRRLSEKRPDVDPEFDELIATCLAKDPAQRPAAADIVRRLGAADVVLEWPPPGAAQLHGALRPLTRLFLAGSLVTAAGFLSLFASGSSVASERLSPVLIGALLAMAVGAALLVWAIARALRVARRLTQAISLGHGWMTVLETLADSSRDTGLLIAGLREYAAISPADRERMRRRRVEAALLDLAAALLPVPMLVVFLWSGQRDLARAAFAGLPLLGLTLAVLPSIVAAVWALNLRRAESKALRGARQRIAERHLPDDLTGMLVVSWRKTLDLATVGQSIAGGLSRRRALGAIVTALVATVTLVALLSFIPIFYIAGVGASFWPRILYSDDRMLIASAARPLVLAPDSSITPIEAGRAYRLLSAFPGPSKPSPLELPVVGWPDVRSPQPESLFSRVVKRSDGKVIRSGGPFGFGTGSGLIAYAAGGFSPAERRWLEQLDASPRWREWTRFARAPKADIAGGLYVTPFPDTVSLLALPLSGAGVKSVAYASVARAAYYRSIGRPAKADSLLRETITAGFRLADDGNSILEWLVGVVTIGIAQEAMHEADSIDHRPDRPEYVARRAAVARYDEQASESLKPVSSEDLDAAALRRRIIASATSTYISTPFRMDNYIALAMVPCTNVRELVAGPDADIRAAKQRARALVDFPSQRALLDLMDRQPEIVGHRTARSGAPVFKPLRPMLALARLSGWVFRNPRIPGCASVLTTDGW